MMYQNLKSKKNVLCFKYFTRKGYSLFSALGREVRIGVLTTATLCVANIALAQNSNTTSIEKKDFEEKTLEEATVMGTRTPLVNAETARIVTVITQKEIEQASVQSITDLLKLVASIDVRQRGSYGIQTDISIEGGTFDQITLLVNGIAINSPQTGHLSADFPVDIEDIDHIEVLQGASSRVFGVQAFSGAINIVTKQTGKDLKLKAEGGSYNTYGLTLQKGWEKDNKHFLLSGGVNKSDGAVRNSDFNQAKLFHQGALKFQDFSLNYMGGFSKKKYGANTFYTTKFPNQWEENERYFVSVKGKSKGNLSISPNVSWVRSYDHFQLIRNTNIGENYHKTDVLTLGLDAHLYWSLGQTTLGAEWRQENILSTKLGERLDSALFEKIDGSERLYSHKGSRENLNFFLEHNITWKKLSVSAGVLVSKLSTIDEKFNVYPGIDLSYHPSKTLAFFASWNTAVRQPTFTDIYYDDPSSQGYIGLKSERSSSFRIGGEFKNTFLTTSIQGFYNKGVDMIDWVKYTESSKFQVRNFTLHNMGGSIQSTMDFKELINYPFSLALNYTYLNQKKGKEDVEIYQSKYALEYLKHKFTANLSLPIYKQLYASCGLRFQEREGKLYKPYTLVDMKIQWRKPKYEIYCDIQNLTNRTYYDFGGVIQPGRWIMSGIKWSF